MTSICTGAFTAPLIIVGGKYCARLTSPQPSDISHSSMRALARAPTPTIFAPPHSSTPVDEGRGEPGAHEPRTGPADHRRDQAGAVPAAQLHSPACARPARRRRHPAGGLLRAGRGEPPADADRARDRLALPC